MIAFGILAVVLLSSAVLMVMSRNPVVCAMWLALTLASMAGLFAVLGAEFLAAIQLIVYAGAILVFFLFVVMLLNLGQLPPGDPRTLQRGLGLWVALTLAGVVGLAIHRTEAYAAAAVPAAIEVGRTLGNSEAVARLMFQDYLIAFELTSVLLTAAVVGAVVLAKRREGSPSASAAGGGRAA